MLLGQTPIPLASMATVTTLRKCSMCQQPGHNKRTCPMRLQSTADAVLVPVACKPMEKSTAVSLPPPKRTVERQIDLLCWNAGLPVDVVRLIKVSLHHSKMAECMAQAFDRSWLDRVCRVHRLNKAERRWAQYSHAQPDYLRSFADPGFELQQVNYGRLLIHHMHPQCYNKQFRLLDTMFARKQVVV